MEPHNHSKVGPLRRIISLLFLAAAVAAALGAVASSRAVNGSSSPAQAVALRAAKQAVDQLAIEGFQGASAQLKRSAALPAVPTIAEAALPEMEPALGVRTCAETGVTVVTTDLHGKPAGMTLNSFTSVSLDPLLVLVCVVRDAVMHKVLDDVGRFGVSVLGAGQEDLARYFSDPTRPMGMAQFLPLDWRPGPVTGAPLLDGRPGASGVFRIRSARSQSSPRR